MEKQDVDAADFVLTGPSNADNVTDEEEEGYEIFNHSGLPGEVSGEIEELHKSFYQICFSVSHYHFMNHSLF